MKDCWDLERLKESEVSSVKEKVRGGRIIVPLIVQSAGPNVLRLREFETYKNRNIFLYIQHIVPLIIQSADPNVLQQETQSF